MGCNNFKIIKWISKTDEFVRRELVSVSDLCGKLAKMLPSICVLICQKFDTMWTCTCMCFPEISAKKELNLRHRKRFYRQIRFLSHLVATFLLINRTTTPTKKLKQDTTTYKMVLLTAPGDARIYEYVRAVVCLWCRPSTPQQRTNKSPPVKLGNVKYCPSLWAFYEPLKYYFLTTPGSKTLALMAPSLKFWPEMNRVTADADARFKVFGTMLLVTGIERFV